MNDKTDTRVFVDDGHPEARDYDDNYVVLRPARPRDGLRLPPKPAQHRREPRPPETTRIEPAASGA